MKEEAKEENLSWNILLRVADRESMDNLGVSELIRTNSDLSSITFHGSMDSAIRNANPVLDLPTVWTEKKHQLYLNSLEADFVHQLHDYINVRGYLKDIIREPYSCQKLPTGSHDFFEQFMESQDGFRQKTISLGEPLLTSTADSHFTQEIPHHFVSSGKLLDIPSCDLRENCGSSRRESRKRGDLSTSLRSAKSSKHHYSQNVCHQASSSIEVSDQNFVGDDHKESSGCVSSAKRKRRIEEIDSKYDQVVPSGDFKTQNGNDAPF